MILITGANGFIGRAMLTELQKTQKEKVFVLLHQNDQILREFDFLIPVYGGLGALPDHVEQLKEVKYIYHFASKSIDSDGTGFDEVNVKGTAAVIALAQAVRAKKIVAISSTGVYGHRTFTDAEEDTTYQPDTPLSASKVQAEKLLSEAHSDQLDIVILRHRFVIGKGDRHIIPRFIRAARKLPFVVRKGKAKTSFIDVRDFALIAHQYMMFEEKLATPEIVHAVNNENVTIAKVLEDIDCVFGIHKKRRSLPFFPLYFIIRTKEILLGVDPESKRAGSLSSIRLKFIAQDNHFSNKKLLKRFPEFEFTPFKTTLENNKSYYESPEM